MSTRLKNINVVLEKKKHGYELAEKFDRYYPRKKIGYQLIKNGTYTQRWFKTQKDAIESLELEGL